MKILEVTQEIDGPEVAVGLSVEPPEAKDLGLGPLSFWFLNHDLEKPELRRQMKELKAKGFSGFFLHSRGGLRVPYGPGNSHRWGEMISYCVREAKALGLEAWLYDEDPYPSGAAGGRVTLEHPEYRASELLATVQQVTERGPVVLDLPKGALVAVYRITPEGLISRADEAAGLVRSRWRQSFSSSGYYPPYTNGAPHWRAETIDPHYQVALNDVEAGSMLVAFVSQAVGQTPWGDYPDMLNADAVRLFIRYTHDAYAELLGSDCGTTVPGIFTDEAKLKGRLPWSAKVPEWFLEVAGVSLLEVLPHLVVCLDEQTPFYRWAYRKALARGLREAMMQPLVEACRRHRLRLTGHISPEEDPVGQVLYAPGLMGLIGQMDLPGTDLIGAALGSREQPLLHLSPKLVSSAAHGRGKRWITCEAFAVCDWAQDLASLTRAVHWLYALGVNRLVTHGQFYSIDGLRKREAPPSQFFQAGYWEHFGAFSTMVELLSRELGQGRHRAPLLLYYPEDSFMAVVSGNAEEIREAGVMREKLGLLVHELLTRGYDFDLADEELLLQVAGQAGRARLSHESFEAVVVPGRYLSMTAWRWLEKLRASGVQVFYVEEMLTLLAEQPRRWRTGGGWEPLWASLEACVKPLWRAAGDLVGHLRETEEGPLLFLCNTGRDTFEDEVSLVFPGPYEMAHPQEGRWLPMREQQLKLESGLGVLIRPQRQPSLAAVTKEELPVTWEGWVSRPCSDNCLVISEFRAISLAAGAERPGIAAFGGAAVVDLLSPALLTSPLLQMPGDRAFLAGFDWKAGDAPVRLVHDTELGEGAMEFFLNGRRLPEGRRRRTYDPMNREVNLAGWVRPGRNELLWVQRCGGLEEAALPYDGVRLFGDFQVAFPFGRPMPARLTPRPECYRLEFPLPASQIGHTHYGGLIAYENRFRFSGQAPERVCMEVGRVFESMEVRVNGVEVGMIWCAPWRVEFPGALLKPGGENELTLICSCSPATYLQALERPSGFWGPVSFRSVNIS